MPSTVGVMVGDISLAHPAGDDASGVFGGAPTWALTSHLVAHSGLHSEGVPENSLAAFAAARDASLAIECDVHLTVDGEVVVFHDQSLTRMCQRSEFVESLTSHSRSFAYLSRTDQVIPTLQEVLAVADGAVPVFVDLKPRRSYQALSGRRAVETARAVGAVLADYSGPVGVMSWDPRQLRWFRTNMPHVLRIQAGGVDAAMSLLPGMAGSFDDLWWNRLSDPHAVSYNAHLLPRTSALAFRRSGRPVLAWTIRSEEAMDSALLHADNVIFEGFTPTKAAPPELSLPPRRKDRSRHLERLAPFLAPWRATRRRERVVLCLTALLALSMSLGVSTGLVLSHDVLVPLMAGLFLAAWQPRRWLPIATLLGLSVPLSLVFAGPAALGVTALWSPVLGAFLGASIRALRTPSAH